MVSAQMTSSSTTSAATTPGTAYPRAAAAAATATGDDDVTSSSAAAALTRCPPSRTPHHFRCIETTFAAGPRAHTLLDDDELARSLARLTYASSTTTTGSFLGSRTHTHRGRDTTHDEERARTSCCCIRAHIGTLYVRAYTLSLSLSRLYRYRCCIPTIRPSLSLARVRSRSFFI